MKLIQRSLYLTLALLPATLNAQIVNGSFEIGGQPSLVGWSFSCSGNQSYHDSPFDTSGWCLKLICGNYQGCFPGIAYQIIKSVKDGDIWRLDAWTKPSPKSLPRSIYWKIFKVAGGSVNLPSVRTSDSGWVNLSIVDTVLMSLGDSAAVVLDAGNGGGPFYGWSYFDLVSANRLGTTDVPPNNLNQRSPIVFVLNQNFPNPFNPSTIIRYALPHRSEVTLAIFNTLGQLVSTLVNSTEEAGYHEVKFDGTNLSSGVYYYRIVTGNLVQTRKLLLLR